MTLLNRAKLDMNNHHHRYRFIEGLNPDIREKVLLLRPEEHADPNAILK